MNVNGAKQQRLAILAQIDLLEKERCSVCVGATANTKEINCQCDAAVEIRKLGVAYEAIAKESRSKRVEKLVNEAIENGLTVDLYQQLRENELNDKQIYTQAGIPKLAFNSWKAEMQLTRAFRAEKPEGVKSAKPSTLFERYGIRQEDFQTARLNGITYHAVVTRLNRNWPLQRAITEPTTKQTPEFAKWLPIAEKNGVKPYTLRRRIEKGESIESAATRPAQKRERVR